MKAGSESNRTGALPASEFVQTLERGLQVIRCFNEETPARTLADVAKAVGLTRAAARRLVLTLEALGYVERTDKVFRLSPRVLELGYSYLASQPWWRHAQKVLQEAGREIGCACAVGVLDRDSVAYVAYTPGGESATVLRAVGTRLPAVATAMGRVLLAHLPVSDVAALLRAHPPARLTPFTLTEPADIAADLERIRDKGYSAVYQQLEVGLFSVGVPIFDRAGGVIAAMSASIWQREPDQQTVQDTFLKPMFVASRRITEGLPY